MVLFWAAEVQKPRGKDTNRSGSAQSLRTLRWRQIQVRENYWLILVLHPVQRTEDTGHNLETVLAGSAGFRTTANFKRRGLSSFRKSSSVQEVQHVSGGLAGFTRSWRVQDVRQSSGGLGGFRWSTRIQEVQEFNQCGGLEFWPGERRLNRTRMKNGTRAGLTGLQNPGLELEMTESTDTIQVSLCQNQCQVYLE